MICIFWRKHQCLRCKSIKVHFKSVNYKKYLKEGRKETWSISIQFRLVNTLMNFPRCIRKTEITCSVRVGAHPVPSIECSRNKLEYMNTISVKEHKNIQTNVESDTYITDMYTYIPQADLSGFCNVWVPYSSHALDFRRLWKAEHFYNILQPYLGCMFEFYSI